MKEVNGEEVITTQVYTDISNQFDFFEPIERAYEWSSKQLIDLIMGEC
jgi:gamma-tubulin complex component 2